MELKRCYGCMRELSAPGIVCPNCGYDNTKDPGLQPSHVLPCGTILNGQYLVGRSLGQGGFGITYIGYDLNLDIPVCIKEYYPEGSVSRVAEQSSGVYWGSSDYAQTLRDGRISFVREARKAVKLRDLNHVVTVWGIFFENETAYIIMDYIEGETIKSRLVRTQRPLGERECVALLTPVMRDLEKIHERGIIHRDIKPENLMIRTDGELMLLDMGAAKDLSTGSGQSSFMVASQGFSPLEQYNRNGRIGPWTDVYGVCATIYYCLTGRRLPTPTERMSGEKIDWQGLTPEMKTALEKGLALQPEDRTQTMGELKRSRRPSWTCKSIPTGNAGMATATAPPKSSWKRASTRPPRASFRLSACMWIRRPLRRSAGSIYRRRSRSARPRQRKSRKRKNACNCLALSRCCC